MTIVEVVSILNQLLIKMLNIFLNTDVPKYE